MKTGVRRRRLPRVGAACCEGGCLRRSEYSSWNVCVMLRCAAMRAGVALLCTNWVPNVEVRPCGGLPRRWMAAARPSRASRRAALHHRMTWRRSCAAGYGLRTASAQLCVRGVAVSHAMRCAVHDGPDGVDGLSHDCLPAARCHAAVPHAALPRAQLVHEGARRRTPRRRPSGPRRTVVLTVVQPLAVHLVLSFDCASDLWRLTEVALPPLHLVSLMRCSYRCCWCAWRRRRAS